MEEAQQYRRTLASAKRIVVKVGTRVLIGEDGAIDHQRIADLANQIAGLMHSDKEVVLVSSGAIGAGLQLLKMKTRPTSLPELQMAAAVGQTELLKVYGSYFSNEQCAISQVLLTHPDLKHRERHLNARNTMLKLLSHKILPIINENDVVSVDEIRVGDNDILSALVTVLIDADLLIILTTPDGLQKPVSTEKTERVAYLSSITDQAYALVTEKTEALSTGGMKTKLEAAQMVTKMGAMAVIASGKKDRSILRVIAGEDEGTLIGNEMVQDKLAKRKRWIRYFHRPEGRIFVDVGAIEALREMNKSLLPIGIEKVEGEFSVGEMVEIVGPKGELVGKGLVEYQSADIEKIKRKPSSEIERILGFRVRDVVIHRDNMVIET